jgi:hypothetical protein
MSDEESCNAGERGMRLACPLLAFLPLINADVPVIVLDIGSEKDTILPDTKRLPFGELDTRPRTWEWTAPSHKRAPAGRRLYLRPCYVMPLMRPMFHSLSLCIRLNHFIHSHKLTDITCHASR